MRELSKENYDFSCWVIKYSTKSVNNLIYQKGCLIFGGECIVPLCWNYQHYNSDSILGKAILEHRDEGVYAYCQFFDNEVGNLAKELVITEELWLGPYVTGVKIDKGYVTHGKIRSVSLILDRVDPYDCYKPVLKGGNK